MSSQAHPRPSPPSFAAAERDLIRREMGPHFGQLPSLADGLLLRTWRDGPQKGEPKLPPAARSMLECGLVEVRNRPVRAASLLPRGGAGSAGASAAGPPGHGPGPLRPPAPGTRAACSGGRGRPVMAREREELRQAHQVRTGSSLAAAGARDRRPGALRSANRCRSAPPRLLAPSPVVGSLCRTEWVELTPACLTPAQGRPMGPGGAWKSAQSGKGCCV